MKTALVIGGGGSKGAFAVGAIEVLRSQGITFDLVAGTSTGALIAPYVAVDDIDGLVKQYTTVRTRDIMRKNWFGFWKGLYHTKPLEKIIRTWARHNYDKLSIHACKIIVCAVSLQSKRAMYWSQFASKNTQQWSCVDDFVKTVLGSSVQPIINPPVDYKYDQLVDGGVREIAPLNIAIKEGAAQIFVIVHSPELTRSSNVKYNNLLSIGARTLDLMLDEIVLNDIKMVCAYNKAIAAGATLLKKRPIQITVIRPTIPLPSDGLTFVPEVMQRMRELGHSAAHAALR